MRGPGGGRRARRPPAVFKLRDSAGSIHVRRVDDLDQLRAAYRAMVSDPRPEDVGRPIGARAVNEAYVPGPEDSADGDVGPDGPVVLLVTYKPLSPEPHFAEIGHSVRLRRGSARSPSTSLPATRCPCPATSAAGWDRCCSSRTPTISCSSDGVNLPGRCAFTDRTQLNLAAHVVVVNRLDDECGAHNDFAEGLDVDLSFIILADGLGVIDPDGSREVVVPELGVETVLPVVEQLIDRYSPLDGLTGLSEKVAVASARLPEKLGLPGWSVDLAVRFRDEVVMKRAVATAGAADIVVDDAEPVFLEMGLRPGSRDVPSGAASACPRRRTPPNSARPTARASSTCRSRGRAGCSPATRWSALRGVCTPSCSPTPDMCSAEPVATTTSVAGSGCAAPTGPK